LPTVEEVVGPTLAAPDGEAEAAAKCAELAEIHEVMQPIVDAAMVAFHEFGSRETFESQVMAQHVKMIHKYRKDNPGCNKWPDWYLKFQFTAFTHDVTTVDDGAD
jgi:hypothetical protein